MRVVAIDTETYPIGFKPFYGNSKVSTNWVPKMVCMTSHDGNRTELLRGGKAVDQFVFWLTHENTHITAHNLTFDVLVLVRAAWEYQSRDILPEVFEAYEQGRMHDTVIRQQLIDIANRGLNSGHMYKLGWLAKYRLGIDVSASKKQDAWRTRYNQLDPWSTSLWPEAAVDYAKTDAILHWRLFQKQQEPAYACTGHQIAGPKGVENEQLQTMGDFAFGLMAAWGMRVDLKFAEKTRDKYLDIQDRLRSKLQGIGVLREDGTQSKTETQRIYERAFLSIGEEPIRTPPSDTYPEGQIATNAVARRKLERLGVKDERFQLLSLWDKVGTYLSTYIEPMLLAHPYPVCTSFHLVNSGRISSRKPNLTNLPKHDIPTDPFKSSDVRRCYIPREGNVFLDADYSTLEMRTFAQVCLNLGIHSEIAEALNAVDPVTGEVGRDLHSDFAAQVEGVSYEDFVRILKDSTHSRYKRIKNQRATAKCFHPDTEVLTPRGWVRIPDLEPDTPVMAAECKDGLSAPRLRWEIPTQTTRRSAESLVHVWSQDAQLAVTPDHRIPTWVRKSGRYHEETAGNGFWSKDRLIYCAGEYEGSSPLPELEKVRLRITIAVQADGSIDPQGHIRFGFTKKRKIGRLDALLDVARVEVHSRRECQMNGKDAVTYKIHKDEVDKAGILRWMDEDKTLSWALLFLSRADRDAILDEAEHWDSTTIGSGRSYHYCSVIQKNQDVLAAIAATTGRKASTFEHTTERYGDKNIWIAVKDRPWSRTGGYKIEERPYGGDVYCLTVPSDAVLVRYNGCTMICHQCKNFGSLGGMGPAAFVTHAGKFKIWLDHHESQQLHDAWLGRWTEVPHYFDYINTLEFDGGVYGVKQHAPHGNKGPWRIRGCPPPNGYTAACNTLFQGMAADGCKFAAWLVAKACYVDKSSPLYGFRPNIFVHDQFLVEGPEEGATEAALELQKLMREGMEVVVCDVPVKSDIALSRRWDVDAESDVLSDGSLSIYEGAT